MSHIHVDQLATFVFKLRRNIGLEGDLLLARMELEAFLPDVVCAVGDIAAFGGELPILLGAHGSVEPHAAGGHHPDRCFGALDAHVRANGVQAYRARGSFALLPDLIRRVSFVQRIYCVTADSEAARASLKSLERIVGPVFTCHIRSGCLVVQAIPHYALFELSGVVARRSTDAASTKRDLNDVLAALLDRTTDQRAIKLAEAALAPRSTTSHLSHDIHYYKAKFFPRLARSLLNVGAQRLGHWPRRVVDTFAGSGTTLLEAATLGMPSVGLDIDPLSVLIATAKLQALQVDRELLAAEATRAIRTLENRLGRETVPLDARTSADGVTLGFPTWLMKNRRMNEAIAAVLSREIHAIRAVVNTAHPGVRDLFRVHLSDAISRHVRLRLLGTGVGRFSLTFASTPLAGIFIRSLERYVKVAAIGEWLRETIHLRLAEAKAVVADARSIPDDVGQFDILVTSPPYLPASSGRESYAKARALSLIALGVGSHADVDDLIDDSIGSMDGDGVDLTALSARERDVVEWLQADELRAIKAAPTARYFLDMRRAFAEMHRVLVPGALAVVVSGKQSTFYRFSTREALCVVPSAEILAEEAACAGFEVEALHHLQLHKSNANARPRSLDDYYETLIMLRKPG